MIVLLLAAAAVVLWMAAVTVPLVRYGSRQMKLGREYMQRLEQDDFGPWIARSEALMTEWLDEQSRSRISDPPSAGRRIVPHMVRLHRRQLDQHLLDLGILRVDVGETWEGKGARVAYVWMGGFDHTSLIVERHPEDGHRVFARYNDYRIEQIWPTQEIEPGE